MKLIIGFILFVIFIEHIRKNIVTFGQGSKSWLPKVVRLRFNNKIFFTVSWKKWLYYSNKKTFFAILDEMERIEKLKNTQPNT